jgi:hypothetical protein
LSISCRGRRIARRNISSGAFSYFFSDDLGSTNKLTNAAGRIQNDSEYYPYGGERVYTQGRRTSITDLPEKSTTVKVVWTISVRV